MPTFWEEFTRGFCGFFKIFGGTFVEPHFLGGATAILLCAVVLCVVIHCVMKLTERVDEWPDI